MSEPATTYTVAVDADKAGTRLDLFLAGALPGLSRTRLQELLASGKVVEVNGRPALNPSLKVRSGQVFAVSVPASPPDIPEPQAIAIDVVFEDEHLLVVDKPAGLVVHPGAGNRDHTLVNALLDHTGGTLSTIGGPLRPGIVHRIDKDTSGLLVVAKTDNAHRDLTRQFALHAVERAYHGIVWGNPKPPSGRIDKAIGRSHVRTRMTVVGHGGKAAVTLYVTQAWYQSLASLVEFRLSTGRTHQIRVHMSSIGYPLVGDQTYSRAPSRLMAVGPAARVVSAFPRQALHAYLIGFRHPATGQALRFSSAIPNDINRLISFLEKM